MPSLVGSEMCIRDSNRALTSLDLSSNEIGAGGAQAIADSLPQSALRRLTINVALDIEQLKTSTSVNLIRNCLLYTSPSPRD